jgi:peptidoglycan/LPS O-acetylase OafA/YrhL
MAMFLQVAGHGRGIVMQSGRYIAGFDTLRACAVVTVMVYHVNKNVPELHLFPVFRHGYLGVDLFFVLSGFLITGILLRSRSEDHFFRDFYARRVLRIWPLYFTILLLTFIILPIARPAYKELIAANCHPVIAYPLFVQNLFHSLGIGPVEVTWSLAIEEQFYFVWPLMIFFLSRKGLTRLCIAVILLSPFLRYLMLHSGWSDENVYRFTLTRLDGLAAGCLLAFASLRLRHSVAMFFLGVTGLFIVIQFQWKSLIGSFALLCFSGVIFMANRGGIVPTWMPLRYLGKISYGLYLLHVPVFDTLREFVRPHGVTQSVAVFVVDMSAAIAVASLSWHFLERPILRFKRHFESESASTVTVRQVKFRCT